MGNEMMDEGSGIDSKSVPDGPMNLFDVYAAVIPDFPYRPVVHVPQCTGARSLLRQAAGGRPNSRLNARLNAASES
jgi:hypothetical protein